MEGAETGQARAVVFAGPRRIVTELRPLPALRAGEVRVGTRVSAISAGTELLYYRGELPAAMALDATLPGLEGRFAYPFTYGYAAAGVVERLGPEVDPAWLGRRVFAFRPHATAFVAPVAELHPLPAGLELEDATFFPTVETAVALIQDTAPGLGERIVVFGQGVVGLSVSAILRRFPLSRLVVVEPCPRRQEAARALGVDAVLAPEADPEEIRGALGGDGADVAIELSGNPGALDAAIGAVGHEGRIVVGSWYGARPVSLDLGSHFHRARLRIVSAQVSHIGPALTGRWSKARRFDLTWRMLREIAPRRWTSHRFALTEAAAAYDLLDRAPADCLEVVLTHEGA